MDDTRREAIRELRKRYPLYQVGSPVPSSSVLSTYDLVIDELLAENEGLRDALKAAYDTLVLGHKIVANIQYGKTIVNENGRLVELNAVSAYPQLADTCTPPGICRHWEGCDGKREHYCRECGMITCNCADCMCNSCPCPAHPWIHEDTES